MMFKRHKTIFAALISLSLLCSCDDLRDNYDDCGVWLEFIYDHNMEYTDSFDPYVGTVNVLVFDESGKLYSSHFATIDELNGRKRLFFGGEGVPQGNYKVVTVGGLTDHFRLSHTDGIDFVPGITSLERVQIALKYEEKVSHEFPNLWFGPTTDIAYKADLSVWPVRLIGQTNKFNISMHRDVINPNTRAEEENPSLFTFEITAPESGVYDHMNRPLVNEPLSYNPHDITYSAQPHDKGTLHLVNGKINTMRLLSGHEGGYSLTIGNTETGEKLMNLDLLALLSATKPARRADGTELPLQEYLDRENDWNVVIVHEGTADRGFVALMIIVNDWIVWETGMGV